MVGEYLSKLIDMEDHPFGTEILNVIVAPCGSGKTTFALETLVPELGAPENTVYLIDTIAGRDQLLKHPQCQCYTRDWRERLELPKPEGSGKITVMTYAYFGALCRYFPDWYCDLDLLICDEIHKLFEMIMWDKSKKIEEEESLYGWAWNKIFYSFHFCEVYHVIAMTATPELLYRQFSHKYEDCDEWYRSASFDDFIHEVEIPGIARHYEQKNIHEYSNLIMLCNQIDADKKGIIYVPRISTMQKCEEALKKRGIRAVSIWSPNNQEWWMDKQQQVVRNYVISNEEIPENVDVLLINKSCETSINIKSHVDYMIIHSSQSDVQTQALGRYRNDLDDLYLYELEADDIVIIPPEMLDKPLFKEDINLFIKEQNIRDYYGRLMKQPMFLEYIIYYGYSVKSGKIKGGKRYNIISKPEITGTQN